MSLNDPLSNVLSAIHNAGVRGRKEFATKNNSTLIRKVLDLMQRNGYLDGYDIVADSRGGSLRIRLNGQLNKAGVIKPRFRVSKDGFESFEKRFLPAKGFGILIVTTNQGLLTHEEAKERGVGGALVSYCY